MGIDACMCFLTSIVQDFDRWHLVEIRFSSPFVPNAITIFYRLGSNDEKQRWFSGISSARQPFLLGVKKTISLCI
jgi:hypothetical protein